jgi:polysaccharide biosynthesis/export protein
MGGTEILTASLLLAAVLVSQAASPKPRVAPQGAVPTPSAPNPGPVDVEEFKIGPEDVLGIHVWQSQELTRVVAVRPDGRISLPLVNDVQAAGLTPTQLRQALMARYKEFDSAIELSVLINEVNSFKVSLVGKVQHPERYRLKAPTTVLDLLAMAGGLAEYADAENIVVLRPEPLLGGAKGPASRFRRIKFNYKRVVSSGGETDNFALQPNDIVIVP